MRGDSGVKLPPLYLRHRCFITYRAIHYLVAMIPSRPLSSTKFDLDPNYPDIEWGALQNGIKEIEWIRINGEGFIVLSRSAQNRQVLGKSGSLTQAALANTIQAAVPSLLPEARISQSEVLAEYDNYYYTHHNRYRPLPVMRVRFDDAEQSWFHLDMNTGKPVGRLTHIDRVARWLYNGLHSLDFALLFQHRPIWDAVMILLCLTGAAFSITSVWIGWRRLHH